MIVLYYLCRSSVLKIRAGIQIKRWQQI